MLGGGFKRVIVVDAAGRPLGMITDGDLVARVRPETRPGLLQALARRVRSSEHALEKDALARDLMSPGVLSVQRETPVSEAIQRALANRRKRLVVVDGDGRAAGIVDRQDLLRAIAT
jgi:CBS domain-containing protein